MIYSIKDNLQKARLPLVIIRMLDNDLCLMIDTGASQNLIDESVYDFFKEWLPDLSEECYRVATFYGESEGKIINIPFTFENQEYNEPFEISGDLIPLMAEKVHEKSGIEVHGILGNNFLQDHGWIIDFKKQEIYN